MNRKTRVLWCAVVALVLLAPRGAALRSQAPPPADVVFRNGQVYTMEAERPWARAVAVRANTIVGVFESDAAAARVTGPSTRIVDLRGRLLLPGFIDGHTHFSQAGALVLDINLMTVADDEGLKKEVSRVTRIVGPGEWITGGLWGAYEQWALGADKAGVPRTARWEPDRQTIDPLTSNNPCLLNSFDSRLYLANTAALNAAGLATESIDGLKRDPAGRVTGLV